MQEIKYLLFDADDTLWDNNKYFVKTTESFFDVCTNSGLEKSYVRKKFIEFEYKIVKEKGYGSKNFIYILNKLFDYLNQNYNLDVSAFNSLLKDFKLFTLQKPVVFSDVPDVLKQLRKTYDLYILTKGNIPEQKNKINHSGLKHFFKKEYVVSEKNDQTYSVILKENDWTPHECCMIGNSPKSDINPALRNGLYAIFVPYDYTWSLDNEKIIENNSKLIKVNKFSDIPRILQEISKF